MSKSIKIKEQFPDEKTIQLISLIKECESLYDIKSNLYHDKNCRKASFANIAAKLDVSGK
jgi:hypothetical protein